jgi:hypothetical protein
MGVDILAYKEKVAPNLILVYSAGKVGKTTTIATLIGEENRDPYRRRKPGRENIFGGCGPRPGVTVG